MRPAARLLWWLGGWGLLGLLPMLRPATLDAWLVLGGAILGLALVDARAGWAVALTARRQAAAILPVGVWSEIRLRLDNHDRRSYRVAVHDSFPQPAEWRDLPRRVWLEPGGWAELRYRLRPLERGRRAFGGIHLEVLSPWRLWWRGIVQDAPAPVRIYPNFAAVAHFALLALNRRTVALGVHQRRRRGEGQEFFQLREYRTGDSLRQIDWRATSRHKKLITKEYQDERNQTILFVLDCGRRMRARDGDLSHFDHALNAMILVSYVALHQGDAVGVMSIGGEARWLAPRQGPAALNSLINTVYDLQPTLRPADFAVAATQLLNRQRKRCLVILMTSLRDEDSEELLAAVGLLRRRHLLLVANLRETVLDEVLAAPVEDLATARLHAATCLYLETRERHQQALRQAGSLVLDTVPAQLPVAMINQYLEIKRSGRL